jgi:hypothetical protein
MTATMPETQASGTQDRELAMLRTAAKLETDNPLWIVVFGVYSRQFIAFPRFNVPIGTMATARYPAALPGRMRRIERAAGAVINSEKRDVAGREAD